MGCDRWQLSEGSISERSLELCASTILKHFSGRGVVGLHVGNFVGVSLAYVTAAVVGANASSVVFSIDPNIPHRGIHNPADKVLRLLGHFGLQKNSVVLTGYSLEKSISNDGKAYTSDYDPATNFATEVSCEDQITWLGRIAPQRFDFAMMDGNHEGSYLRREIKALDDLLAPGGMLILDDLNWSEVSEVFMSAIGGGYRQVAGDGRVGILQKPSAS
ncbi:MAG: hypothetical protein JWL69_2140 [Phycisphaerales bacterium]|nr:hypothetical protein [Phycisphaerales bacterium]